MGQETSHDRSADAPALRARHIRPLAQLTDLHLDDPMAIRHGVDTRAQLLRVLTDLKRREVGEVILTGDLGEPQTFPWLLAQLSAYNLAPTFLPGNHDVPDTFLAHTATMAYRHADRYYHAAERSGFLRIFLDSRDGRLGDTQTDWLSTNMQRSPLPMLIFIHHPVLDCGHTPMDRLFPLLDRADLRQLLLSHPHPVHIISGHYHAEHLIRDGSLTQYVTLSTYAQLKTTGDMLTMDGTDFGYRLLWLENGRLETETVRLPSH